MPRSVVLPTLFAVAIAIGVAGCKSGDTTTAAGSSTAAPTTTTSGAAPTASAASPTARPVDNGAAALTTLPAACPTAALVSSTLGISAATPQQSKTATTLDCMYLGAPAKNSVSINFTTAKKLTPAQAEAALKAQGTSSKFQPVSGLGDAAFYDAPPTGGSYIAVLSGSLSFHVVDGAVVSAGGMTALARAILAG
jgi:hypothetical protein